MEELFKILYRNKCEYTTNNNGIFINLTWLDEGLVRKIDHFIQFCHCSKQSLDSYSERIEEIRDAMNRDSEVATAESVVRVEGGALKDDQESVLVNELVGGRVGGRVGEDGMEEGCGGDLEGEGEGEGEELEGNPEAVVVAPTETRRSITSTMRFYLLKKRFAKVSVLPSGLKNELGREAIPC